MLEVVTVLITYPIKYVFHVQQDLNIHVFNMITGKNEIKILTRNISCKCKCKFEKRKFNSNQKWNKDKC